jgi:hypothetical protein
LSDILVALLLLEPLTYLFARPCSVEVTLLRVQPIPAGATPLGSENLNLFTGAQLVVERHQAAVDSGTAAAVPNLGMDEIGKVHRCCPLGQVHDLAFGSKHVNALWEDVALQGFDKLAGILDFLAPIGGLPQPGNLGFQVEVALDLLLITPVCGNAIFRHPVHFPRTDLYLQRTAFWPNHGRVQ